MMTKGELRAEVFRRLQESASAPVYWTADDVDAAVAEGYAEVSDASEWFEAHAYLPLLKDRPLYDLRTVLGEQFLAVGGAFDVQTNRWLIPSTTRQFDAHDRRWERIVGEPQRLFMHGLWWLGLWPRIMSEVGQVKQYYVALPPPLDGDGDEPGFSETFHYALVEFALTDLWAQDGETALALASWEKYLSAEAALVTWVANRGGAATMAGFGGAPMQVPH